jgi:hypothetical protein
MRSETVTGSPAEPDLVVDFVDIFYALEAFRGKPYPFDGPGPCN